MKRILFLICWRLPFKTKRMNQFIERFANDELVRNQQEFIKLNWQRYELERQLERLRANKNRT